MDLIERQAVIRELELLGRYSPDRMLWPIARALSAVKRLPVICMPPRLCPQGLR